MTDEERIEAEIEAYRVKHERERLRKYYYAHKSEMNARAKQWQKDHREQANENHRRWREKNREHINQKQREKRRLKKQINEVNKD